MQFTPIEVFYSFAEEDSDLLEHLERHLRLMQHNRLIFTWHKRQVVGGKNWRNEIDYHLNTASLILLLVSPYFLASDYLYGVELRHAMERVHRNEALVIPILLRPCNLKGAAFEDLQSLPRNGKPITSWRNRDEAFDQIAKEVQIALQVLAVPPSTSLAPMHVRTRILGSLPLVRTPVGRDGLFDVLKQQLQHSKMRSSVVVLHGQPGVGKTTIAAHLANDSEICASFSGGILWADLGAQPSLNDILTVWASQIQADIFRATTIQEKFGCIKAQLGQHPFLLILDDLWPDGLNIINPLLRMVDPGCAVVLTTQWRKVADDLGVLVGSTQLFVEELNEQDALKFLMEICQNNPAHPELLHSLVKATGGLPLALEIVGASIGNNELAAIPDRQGVLHLVKPWRFPEASNFYRLSVQKAIDRSVNNLPDGKTKRAFWALGVFAPKPATFSKAAAQYVTGANIEVLQTLCNCNLLHESSRNRYMFHQSLSNAAQTHLRISDTAYLRHRIYYQKQVQSVVSLKQNERNGLSDIDWRNLFLDLPQIRAIRLPKHTTSLFSIVINRFSDSIPGLQLLNRYLPGWLKDVMSHILLTGLLFLITGARVTRRKQIEATLSNYQGWFFAELGDRKQALIHYQRAHKLWDTFDLNPGHPDRLKRAQVLNSLGKPYYMMARYRQALKMYHCALTIYRNSKDQGRQAHVHTNIGATFDMIGRVNWAIKNFQSALYLYQQVQDKRGEAFTLHHLGVAYNGLGQREKALFYLEQALSMHMQANNEIGRARTLMEMGSVYLDAASVVGQEQVQTSLEAAMNYFQQALILQTQYGDLAWQGRTLSRIGLVYAKQGKMAQALDFYLRALSAHQNVNYHAGLSTSIPCEMEPLRPLERP